MKLYSLSDLRFLKPATLRAWFHDGRSGSVAVVDVRDSDYMGGHIRGCYHYPAGNFHDTLPELQTKLFENKITDVVFHCALLQVRGPSSTLKFLRSLSEITDADRASYFETVRVWVLEGGFTAWQQQYGGDEAVTEDYVPELWE